jgi:hypothetical protein
MASWNTARLLETAANTQDGPELLMDLVEGMNAFAVSVTESLDKIEKLLTPPLPDERGKNNNSLPEAIILRVRVVTAGKALQGPDVAVPEGVASVIRQRRHSNSPNGYVALNERDVSSTGSRIEMVNGDTVVLQVSNWNKIWFDADTASTDFELIAEQ